MTHDRENAQVSEKVSEEIFENSGMSGADVGGWAIFALIVFGIAGGAFCLWNGMSQTNVADNAPAAISSPAAPRR